MNIPIIRVEVLVMEAEIRFKDELSRSVKNAHELYYEKGRRDALRDLLREARQKRKEESMKIDRKKVLLKAAYDLLRKANDSHYVEQAISIKVRYDNAECDGYCLMEDIAEELGIED